MFKATERICEVFDEHDLKYRTDESDNRSVVIAGIGTELTQFQLLFISSDDDNDVAMRIYNFVSFKEEKLARIVNLANQLNNEFRYLKFVVDNDNSVTLAYDFPVTCEDPGIIALEMLSKIMNFADEIYEKFMKELWS
ncbi:MAG: YbjN domain-containing protein [Oscillospiraceae bacterium]|nr:YbjN domain-containing protein [Oscillospiraceae bacterium]